MSLTIWGNTLFGNTLFGNINGATDNPISNLNNWTWQDISQDLVVDYDPVDKVNQFTYDMPAGHYERMYYKFELQPNTDYMFHVTLGIDLSDAYAIQPGETIDYRWQNNSVKDPIITFENTSSDHVIYYYKTIDDNGRASGLFIKYGHYGENDSIFHNVQGGDIINQSRWHQSGVSNICHFDDRPFIELSPSHVFGPEISYSSAKARFIQSASVTLAVTKDIINESKTFEELEPQELILSQDLLINYNNWVDPERRSDIGVPFSSGSMPYVYLYIDYTSAPDGESASYVIKNVNCDRAAKPGIFHLKGPIYLNGENEYYYENNDSVYNIALAYPGAWVWSFLRKDPNKHHIYALSGNEFKFVAVNTSYNNGYQYTIELQSEPIVINGRTFYKVYKCFSDITAVDVISYNPPRILSDDEIYTELSKCVMEMEPTNYYEVMTEDSLYTILGVSIDAIDADEVPSALGLTDDEFHDLVPESKTGIDYSAY